MTQTTTITSGQETGFEELKDKILLSPTNPNAEFIELTGYKLVYCDGACPRTYGLYKGRSMVGLIFQHLTHWSNVVDKIRYAQPLDAAVGLDDFMKITGISRATTQQQPPTPEELLDKPFEELTAEEWEQLKEYQPQSKAIEATASAA